MTYRTGLSLALFYAVLAGAPSTVRSNPSNPFGDGEYGKHNDVISINDGQSDDTSFDDGQYRQSEDVTTVEDGQYDDAQVNDGQYNEASVDEAVALAQQAAELGHRAAQMAAAAQNQRASINRPRNPGAPQSDGLTMLLDRSFRDGYVIHAADEELLPPAAGQEELVPPVTGPEGLVPPAAEQFLQDDQPGNACCEPCGPPPRPLIWVSGVEASFLWPTVNSEDGAGFEFENEEDESEWVQSAFSDDVDSMYLTPRIWVGIQGCKWGANLRYWHLRANEGGFDQQLDQLDDSHEWDHSDWDWEKDFDTGFFSNNRLDVYTIDLEVNRRFCIHDCAMQASVGVRHGSIEHHESIVGTVMGDDARFVGYASSDRYTHGTGLVLGLYGRKPLFPCSCVHWFYNARWSALWGPTMTAAETFAAVMADGSSAGSINNASTCVDDNMFIGEIQLGLEWNYALRCLPANAFCRAAIEYQRWGGGMGFSESGSFASFEDDDDFESEITTFASADTPELDLFGITLGTGLTW